MSTTRPSRFITFLTFWVIPACFVGSPFAFYQSKDLTGWGLLITALLLRLSVIQYEQQNEETEQKPEQSVADPSDDLDNYDDDNVHLDMTTPWLQSQSGWENVAVYPKANIYRKTLCFGGPPVLNRYWEFDVKDVPVGDDFVFHRLRDDNIDDLWDPRYDVVNGRVLEQQIESRFAEDEFKAYSLEHKLTELRREVQWHELDGIIKYLILSKVRPHGSWRRQAEKLKESVGKIAAKAQEIGATLNEDGWYELPEDASADKKAELDKLFSQKSLRNAYGFRSYREWRERNHIFKLLEPEPATASEPATDPESTQAEE